MYWFWLKKIISPDLVASFFVLWFAYLGAYKGLKREICSVVNYLFSLFLTAQFGRTIYELIYIQTDVLLLRSAVAHSLIFITSMLFISFITKKFINKNHFKNHIYLDSIIGSGLGILKSIILFLVITVIIEYTTFADTSWWNECIFSKVFTKMLTDIKDYLPLSMVAYLTYK